MCIRDRVCGTRKGITSVQMDIKIPGLSREVLQRALKQARDGRLYILDKMAQTIAAPNKEMSKYAPRIYLSLIHISCGSLSGFGPGDAAQPHRHPLTQAVGAPSFLPPAIMC